MKTRYGVFIHIVCNFYLKAAMSVSWSVLSLSEVWGFFFLHSFLGIFKLLWSFVLPESLTSGSFSVLPHTPFYDSLAYKSI